MEPETVFELDDDLSVARWVLDFEARAVLALANKVNVSFQEACDLLDVRTGRVIVTGMGKSGHIGRKIAATFSSTGTPAHYVHPGEASHGDLGMVQSGDVLLALSNSGATHELQDLIEYIKFIGIPLIVIVGRNDSVLSEAANVSLVLPSFPEACPMGLAPTTSTTMMLALGDALAVALMRRRGFSDEQFQLLHPGGRLGRNFIKVEDLMHRNDEVPLVISGALMSEALLVMTKSGFGCTGILNSKGFLIGIITDGDLRRHMNDNLLTQTVDKVMTINPKTTQPKVLAVEALELMSSAKSPFTQLFVTVNKTPVGFLHMHDILRAGIA